MHNTKKSRIIDRLQAEFGRLPSKLQLVAKHIVDHPADFGLDPIRTTAEKAGVSTNTLVRMAEQLGFESYEELRSPFRSALLTTSESIDDVSWLDAMSQQGEAGKRLGDASRNTLSIVHRTLHEQDPEYLSNMVTAMFAARHIYVTGYRGCFGLAHYFYYVARMVLPNMVLIPAHTGSPMDELVAANSDDILFAVTFSPYSREIISACQYAEEKEVPLFLLTDSPMIAPKLNAAKLLVASTLTTHHFECHAGAMALLEALLAMIVQEGGQQAEARISAYEDILHRYEAYRKVQPRKT